MEGISIKDALRIGVDFSSAEYGYEIGLDEISDFVEERKV